MAVAGGRATVCTCGNHFMNDSKFCRRCGQPRPGVVAAQSASLAARPLVQASHTWQQGSVATLTRGSSLVTSTAASYSAPPVIYGGVAGPVSSSRLVLQAPSAVSYSPPSSYVPPPMVTSAIASYAAPPVSYAAVASPVSYARPVLYAPQTVSYSPPSSYVPAPMVTYSPPVSYVPPPIVSPPVSYVPAPVVSYAPPVQYPTQMVVSPVIQELRREPIRNRETHHVFRAKHDVEFVETEVAVPTVRVEEVEEEVTQVLLQEVIVEVPDVSREEVVRQVPRVEYQEREKAIRLPVFEAHERIVEVPQRLMQEVIVDVPEVQVIELVREIPKPRVQVVQKHVERPVVHVQERVVQVPMVTVQEQIIEVPVVEIHEMIKEVAVPSIERVEKPINVPVNEIMEREVEVLVPEYLENPVEVPEVEYREVIKQVPKYEIKYIDKKVVKHQIEYIEKLVEVPHYIYEERIVEVPEVERVEIVRHKPVMHVQQVPKHVPKHILQVHQRQVDVSSVLEQEYPVEVPEVVLVEAIIEVPRPIVETIPREIQRVVGIQGDEVFEEVPFVVRQERPLEIPQVQVVDAITQVILPDIRYTDKQVPYIETQAVERTVEVVQRPLIEEYAVAVPQVQIVEAVRQELVEVVHRQTKQVPKVTMEYRERLVEVQHDHRVALAHLSGQESFREQEEYLPRYSPAYVRDFDGGYERPIFSPARLPGRQISEGNYSQPTTRPASPYSSRYGSLNVPPAGFGSSARASAATRPPPSGNEVSADVTELDRDSRQLRPQQTATFGRSGIKTAAPARTTIASTSTSAKASQVGARTSVGVQGGAVRRGVPMTIG